MVFRDKSLVNMVCVIYPAPDWPSSDFYSYIVTDLFVNNNLELCRLALSVSSVSVCATGLTRVYTSSIELARVQRRATPQT